MGWIDGSLEASLRAAIGQNNHQQQLLRLIRSAASDRGWRPGEYVSWSTLLDVLHAQPGGTELCMLRSTLVGSCEGGHRKLLKNDRTSVHMPSEVAGRCVTQYDWAP